MTAKYDIRVMSRQEFDIAVGWAETEGWKPGIDDAAPESHGRCLRQEFAPADNAVPPGLRL